ncbi:flagellar hook-associated protein FlgK [Halothermothrix orenii]|uniref:Flagellar hook-associated protein 1 n=1 Tax=Halothermothrix orenii (strain H 168 / OCM 544 / DSM 9562) TaxID=373903 RepID=B8CYU4_HALOH|nr:flagellar hook-associated protein FlgK [Halothermothrix orenii]ACL70463.1 flagellar hook-associated protein FlgK [Halothermothrix orenii H 168]
MSTFYGIELGKRALQVQKKSLDVTGHNIANANTEGYSRQRAVHTTTDPYTVPGFTSPAGAGQVGTGVKIEQIVRLKDDFITSRINNETQDLGAWEARKDNLHQIELIFNEPSENGLRNLMDLFWSSWHELSLNPESEGVRSTVREQAKTLIEGFKSTYNQLIQLKDDINHDIDVNVQRVNTLGEKIAMLNKRIVAVESDPQKRANDLRDKRDLLVKKLAKYINVQAHEDGQGNLNLSIGGVSFVTGDTFHKIELEEITLPGTTSYKVVKPVWSHINSDVTITSGKIKGAMDVRDKDIIQYIDKLNELVEGIVTEVNSIHSSGEDLNGNTGVDFFDSSKTTADTMSLDSAIESDLNAIAAAQTGGGVGDGRNAEAIAELQNALTMSGNKSTFNEFYTSIISGLGVEAEKANMMYDNQEVMINNLENKQASISGVSLDEEMANMIKFQQAYNAAAKMVSKVDEMLNTLINGMI